MDNHTYMYISVHSLQQELQIVKKILKIELNLRFF